LQRAEECKLRIVGCPNGCGVARAPDHVMREHVRNACVRRSDPCEQCGRLVPLNLMAAHEKDDCPRRMVRCGNACSLMVRAEQLEEHLAAQCAYRLVPCGNQCGESARAFELEAHMKAFCTSRLVVCANGCGTVLPSSTQRVHNDTCDCRLVPCTLGCGMRLREIDLDEHILMQCSSRLVACPHACGVSTAARVIGDHAAECVLRRVRCGLGCGAEVRFCDVEAHRGNKCERRRVKCTLGCAAEVSLAEMGRHIDWECPLRRIWCRFGCKQLVVAQDARAHEKKECSFRFVRCPNPGCDMMERAAYVEDHATLDCVYRRGSSAAYAAAAAASAAAATPVAGPGLARSPGARTKLAQSPTKFSQSPGALALSVK
jgi:hypothetical protein